MPGTQSAASVPTYLHWGPAGRPPVPRQCGRSRLVATDASIHPGRVWRVQSGRPGRAARSPSPPTMGGLFVEHRCDTARRGLCPRLSALRARSRAPLPSAATVHPSADRRRRDDCLSAGRAGGGGGGALSPAPRPIHAGRVRHPPGPAELHTTHSLWLPAVWKLFKGG